MRWRRRAGVSLALAALLVPVGAPAGAAAAALAPRPPHRTLPAAPAREGARPRAVEVKFREGLAVRLRAGRLLTPEGQPPAGVEDALLAHPVLAVGRLFSQPEADVAAERRPLEAAAGRELPDLNLWYRLRLAPGTEAAALAGALAASPDVETAYPAPLPAPPPGFVAGPAGRPPAPPTVAGATTPDFTARQGYEKAAPGGIGTASAWPLAGGRGQRARIVDIEYAFNAAHEDLPPIPVIAGAQYLRWGADHGTAVLGELAGADNGFGVRGIAFRSAVRFASPCGNDDCFPYAPADAVNAARLATAPGDVILLEQQIDVCAGGYGPIEWIPSVYDAVAVATAGRRVVVEAAGNGGVDLDDPACAGAFDRAARDSGAIIVGAGAPPGYSQADRSRLGFSTFGGRVDLQGWGAYVVTTGYGNLHAGSGPNQRYTDSFGGTSGAAPIVAGAAALLGSIARQRGAVLAPARTRSLLASTGSPQQDAPGFPAAQRVGPRPNLGKAILELERPRTLAPAGDVADDTPTYRWTLVPGASRYRIEVRRAGAALFTAEVPATACAAGACAGTPARPLATGAHSWRARALVGDWKAWGAPSAFTVTP